MPKNRVISLARTDSTTLFDRSLTKESRRKALGYWRNMKVNPPPSKPVEQIDTSVPKPPPPKHWYQQRGRQLGTLNEWRDAVGAFLGGETAMPYVTPTDSRAGVFKKCASPLGGWSLLLFNYHNRTLINRPIGSINNLIKQKIISTPSGYDPTIASNATKGFSGIHGVWSSVVWGKRSYDIGYDILADIKTAKDRHKMQKLLKQFNPTTCQFVSPTGGGAYDASFKFTQMHQLMAKKHGWNTNDGGNIWRSHKQRALDILTRAKDNTITLLSTAIPNLVLTGVQPTNNLLQAGLAITTVGHGLATINNFARMGVQGTAIANIEKARRNAKRQVNNYRATGQNVRKAEINQLLVNASNRMIQERTYQSRMFFWQGVSYALSTVGCGLASSIGGIPAAVFFLGSAITIPICGGFQHAFTFWHGRKLAQRRGNNAKVFKQEAQSLKTKTDKEKFNYYRDLDTAKKIGLVERHLLDVLRNGDQEESMEVYEFLKACGISENTIKSLFLMDEAKALANMQNQMYNARSHVSLKNSKGQAHRVIGYMTGITYFRRWIRNKQAKNSQTDMTDSFTPNKQTQLLSLKHRFPSTESLPRHRQSIIHEDFMGRVKTQSSR